MTTINMYLAMEHLDTPQHIKQLYTFHVFKDGYYGASTSSLSFKQKPSYDKMIEMLKRHGGPELRIHDFRF